MHLVSVIIPVFNRENFLVETIESIVAQTYPHWELLLVDDGSTDASMEIAKAFAYKDNRIQSIQRNREPKGAPTCRNIGMKRAKGTYIIFLDSDDLLKECCLEQRVRYMLNHSELHFSVWNVSVFWTDGRKKKWTELFYSDDIKSFLQTKGWSTPSSIYLKSAINEFQWSEGLLLWQDWDFHLDLLLSEKLVYHKLDTSEPDVLIRRSHQDRISSGVYQPDSLRALNALFLKTEQKFITKQLDTYQICLYRLWFKYVEFAAINFDKNEFIKVFSIWRSSKSNHYWLYSNYFLLQNNLRFENFHFLQSIPYRLMNFFFTRECKNG